MIGSSILPTLPQPVRNLASSRVGDRGDKTLGSMYLVNELAGMTPGNIYRVRQGPMPPGFHSVIHPFYRCVCAHVLMIARGDRYSSLLYTCNLLHRYQGPDRSSNTRNSAIEIVTLRGKFRWSECFCSDQFRLYSESKFALESNVAPQYYNTISSECISCRVASRCAHRKCGASRD